jgi:hypothetical protein
MYRERIRANPNWKGHPRFDTVLVTVSDDESEQDEPFMHGMLVARVLLFFSFYDPKIRKEFPCALVNWFVPASEGPDLVTHMWIVKPEVMRGNPPLEVIHLDTIVRGAHLLPEFGHGFIPEAFSYTEALDAFKRYLVNHFIDYHAHELIRASESRN